MVVKPLFTADSAASAKSEGVRSVENNPLFIFPYKGTNWDQVPPKYSHNETSEWIASNCEIADRTALNDAALTDFPSTTCKSSNFSRSVSLERSIPFNLSKIELVNLITSLDLSPFVISTVVENPFSSKNSAKYQVVLFVATAR